MRFAYYGSLSVDSRRTYRKSDAIERVELGEASDLVALAAALRPALESGDRAATECACQLLVDALNARLQTPAIQVHVHERRPHNAQGELHGLYEPDEATAGVARISLWMLTARKEQVVRFRTFLRTLVHEVCHHLDYEHYRLAETFHTQGFYARESALVRELLGEPPAAPR